ncbi:NO-inducible flavohemoprotein [Radicibacter daui]|uniref:NO-inducible flavohemoprotein n=1 Tax=Radicibacter daui TaxID=3064829 RepID=UPI0040468EDB
MTTSLSPQTIAIVKACVPALADHGPTITATMYRRLFEDAHIRALFNDGHHGDGGTQVQALAGAILAYARNIENPGVLMGALERIAQKHIGYHILPEHYPYVAAALLGAIKEVLGEAATDEVLAAWGEAYWFLAHILMGREQVIRDTIIARDGGWEGWRDFAVVAKVPESSTITSFVLRPADGGKVLRHRAGQYLTFSFEVPGAAQPLKRNYSISCAPNGETYRISVKREAHGAASRFLHDLVEVGSTLKATPPAGDFHLADEPLRPVVLLSGGVGLTPMVSMIETIAARHPELEAHFIHGTLGSHTHAMDKHVRSLAASRPGLSVATFYSEPAEGDRAGETHDVDGFITAGWLAANTPVANADYFLCGPRPFLKAMVPALASVGVAADRIHYEFFGPADEVIAA